MEIGFVQPSVSKLELFARARIVVQLGKLGATFCNVNKFTLFTRCTIYYLRCVPSPWVSPLTSEVRVLATPL